MTEQVIVEPVGGFTGGNVGHVRSEGRVDLAALSAADRAQVDELFARPQPAANMGYRLTRTDGHGSHSVTVPADKVPAALIASIRTTLE